MIISKATAQRIQSVWDDASGLGDAMKRAGLKSADPRKWHRNRREAEKILGITLVAHNQRQSPANDEVSCPSTLIAKDAAKAKRFVITSATNNSALNERFFDAIEEFSLDKGAQIFVIPIKYRHNTLIKRNDYSWPERIYPYAVTSDIILNKSLVVSSLNLVATAANPLSGLQENSGARSAIYGHTQVALQSIATPGNDDPKLIMTTGSCTAAKYTKTKQGGKARFHHSFSATYVQIIGGKYIATQIHWDGKGFYFLSDYYTPSGRQDGQRAAALVQGDSHAVYSVKSILDARQRLVDVTDPEALVWHDLHDHKYQSHHNTRFDKISLALKGEFLVEKELEKSLELVNDFGKGRLNLIVGSNHNDALDKWLDRFNPDHDPHNAVFAWELGAAKLRSGHDAFRTWIEDKLKVKTKFLSRNKAHKIKGVDVSQHGDIGQNGARGSAASFARLSAKTVIGHSHSAGIVKGCYQVGVSTKAMEYAKGYSSWLICDCLIYVNGKRALMYQIDGKTLADF